MNKNEIKFWMGLHALILVLLFSVLLPVKKETSGIGFPLLPEAFSQSDFGYWIARNMGASSADQWIYFHESQYILHGTLDSKFLAYKERSVEGDSLPIVQKEGIRLPYRDLSFEYPPVAFLPILIPGIFTSDMHVYRILFSLIASMAYLGALWVFIQTYPGVRNDESSKKSFRTLMMVSLAFLIFMGPIVVCRLDVFPVLFVALGLRAAEKKQAALSGAFLALGVAAKLYPLILVPVFFLYWIQSGLKGSWLRFVLGFAVVLGIIYLPVMIVSPQGYLHSLSYHSDRGVEIESIYASFAQIRHVMGFPAEVYSKYGSKNIFWPGEEWVKRYWIVFSLFALGLCYLHAWIGMKEEMKPADSVENRLFYPLAEATFLSVLALLTFSKVLSVQYILWLFPLFLWVGMRHKRVFPLVLQIALGTQLIYPFFFTDLIHLKKPAIALLLWRNTLLVLLFLSLIQWKSILKGLKSEAVWFSHKRQGRI